MFAIRAVSAQSSVGTGKAHRLRKPDGRAPARRSPQLGRTGRETICATECKS